MFPKFSLAMISVPALCLGMILTGCGSSGGSGKSGSSTSNLGLITPGVLTVGSDTSYPPMEYASPGHPGTYIGADVDLAKALAKAMGLKSAKIVSGNFDTLITSLQAKRYDVIMSSMNDTKARAQQVSFVDYMTAREGVLVKKSSSIHGNNYQAFCGDTVSVERGTTELMGLDQADSSCGSKKINIQSYPADSDAFQAFNSGHANVYTSDLPVVAYYIKQHPTEFRLAGKAISASANYGIALRKGNNALKHALQKALTKIRSNGTYTKILQKWGVGDAALK